MQMPVVEYAMTPMTPNEPSGSSAMICSMSQKQDMVVPIYGQRLRQWPYIGSSPYVAETNLKIESLRCGIVHS